MNKKNIAKTAIFLIILTCLIGAANAADNTTSDTLDATADQTVTTDTINEDTTHETVPTEAPKTTTDDTKKTKVADSKKLQSSNNNNVLGDGPNVIYVNVSKESSGDGHDWENAYGGDICLMQAFNNINNNGIIYIADGKYEQLGSGPQINCTLIGLNRDKVIFDTYEYTGYGSSDYYGNVHSLATYINITFKNPSIMLQNGHHFINCTFSDPNILTNPELSRYVNPYTIPESDIDNSFVTTFTNCEFINYDMKDFTTSFQETYVFGMEGYGFIGSLFEACECSQINFNKCTFENITANYIVSNVGGFRFQDGIYFSECSFNNVNVKAIVNVPTGTSVGLEANSRVIIEDCTYNGASASVAIISTEGDRDYINATAPRIQPKISAEIKDETLVVNLTDDEGNPITEDVSISVNGANLGNWPSDPIPISTLIGDNTGLITLDISFNALNDFKQYKTASTSIIYDARNTTSIIADDLTTEVNVAKNVTVTLKDNNNQTLANKNITVSINGQNTTITTDENGTANIPINYAKAGKYTYTLFFAGDDTNYKNTTKTVTVTITEQKQENNKTDSNQPSNPVVQPKKVTKKTSKIVASAKTYKAKIKVKKFTITLKSGKKTIRNVKVTLTVNKKKYTAKTKNNGQATFKITKLNKKGTYKAKITFKGNKNYKASNKTVKIIIIKK